MASSLVQSSAACMMAKFESDALLRISRCEDGFADDVDAVGKINGAVGVCVDDALNVIADVFPCLSFYVIGDNDVASCGVHLGEECRRQCQEQGDECQSLVVHGLMSIALMRRSASANFSSLAQRLMRM